MLIPEVVGFRLSGELKEGITATDLVLTVTQMLRAKGVVGRFVEFFGPGLDALSLADRATIANMAPEYGATCGFFPIDERTHRLSASSPAATSERIELVRAYAKAQGMWRDASTPDPVFTDTLELDMTQRRAVARRAQAAAGPGAADRRRRPVQRRARDAPTRRPTTRACAVEGEDYDIGNGDVVIAAITSCTNTSNPSVLVAAGLVARKARALGPRRRKPWVKTSLAPGSQVVTDYLERQRPQRGPRRDRLQPGRLWLHHLHRQFGPAAPSRSATAIADNDLVAASVLSGNRNFEGRVSPDCRANYLASPPLVVAYALKGTVRADMINDADRHRQQRRADVYLKDIWPTNDEVRALIDAHVHSRHVPQRAMPTSITATSAGRRSRSPAATPTAGRRRRPISRTRPTSPA